MSYVFSLWSVLGMFVCLSVCLSVCLNAFFSAISKPTGTSFGTKLLFGPGKVLKQQYWGKRKKCGNGVPNKTLDFRFGSVTKKI